MDRFGGCWAALRAAVAGLDDQQFDRPSGCAGWLIRDLVCHLIIDAQDVLITLATPDDSPPTRNAVTYWEVAEALPPDDPVDPLSALTVRLAAAYGDPSLLKFHLDDVGSAAGRAAALADPEARVGTGGQVLTVRDYLGAYVLEVDAAPSRPDRAPSRHGAAAGRRAGLLPKAVGIDSGLTTSRLVA